MRKKRIFLAAVLSFIIMSNAGCGQPAVSPTPVVSPTASASPSPTRKIPGVFIGDRAPDFELPDLNGNLVTINEFRGRPVFLNVWSPT